MPSPTYNELQQRACGFARLLWEGENLLPEEWALAESYLQLRAGVPVSDESDRRKQDTVHTFASELADCRTIEQKQQVLGAFLDWLLRNDCR